MIGVNVKTRNRTSFLVSAIARRKAELLDEFGQNTARHVRESMKVVPADSRQSSPPGSPPYVRSPEPNLRTIRHRVSGDRVRVAPVRLAGRIGSSDSVPARLEHGAMVIQRRRLRRGGFRTIRYYVQPRPFMRPNAIKAIGDLHRSVKRKGFTR